LDNANRTATDTFRDDADRNELSTAIGELHPVAGLAGNRPKKHRLSVTDALLLLSVGGNLRER
jgi:hypothetical protein